MIGAGISPCSSPCQRLLTWAGFGVWRAGLSAATEGLETAESCLVCLRVSLRRGLGPEAEGNEGKKLDEAGVGTGAHGFRVRPGARPCRPKLPWAEFASHPSPSTHLLRGSQA
ncbi:hypothetical protein CMEL01_00954 [Colletotrichum melonis]|uniref:Uncharacterized protein n=2 Tax=Colletotrichum acutatum species complex TaxID=2707335 RepID=A0AAI9V262_9PEZI|nr:hypothetical protein CLIM01_09656 [Colletotrichum limetticola]KAK1469187.1 hypothetical protein CMEL01_00954 [Colletotrichum melonis]